MRTISGITLQLTELGQKNMKNSKIKKKNVKNFELRHFWMHSGKMVKFLQKKKKMMLISIKPVQKVLCSNIDSFAGK